MPNGANHRASMYRAIKKFNNSHHIKVPECYVILIIQALFPAYLFN